MSEQNAMLEAGLSFHKRGSLEEANSCYQRVLELDPECDTAWYLSGRLAMEVGMYEEAEAFLAQAVSLSPTNADYVMTQGTLYANTDRLDEAYAAYEKAVELAPELQEAYLGIAQVLVKQKRFAEAQNLATPLRNRPGELGRQARLLVGKCLFEQGDIEALFQWWRDEGHDLSAGRVLHVGCGTATIIHMPKVFQNGKWQEIRLDIDPALKPDILASITDMASVQDASVDAVFSSHNIEHLFHHEVPVALREFHRVLAPGGALIIRTPDLQTACEMVAQDRVYDTAYMSSAGPIAPIDMIYSYRNFLLDGNIFMLHKTGFTASTLKAKLLDAGFESAFVKRTGFELSAVGFKNAVE